MEVTQAAGDNPCENLQKSSKIARAKTQVLLRRRCAARERPLTSSVRTASMWRSSSCSTTAAFCPYPKVFDVLRVLVQHSGHLVAKDELLAEVWNGSFVEEGALSRSVSILRKTLGENGSEEKYIETVPKRGYRFIAQATEWRPADPDVIVAPTDRAASRPSQPSSIAESHCQAISIRLACSRGPRLLPVCSSRRSSERSDEVTAPRQSRRCHRLYRCTVR